MLFVESVLYLPLHFIIIVAVTVIITITFILNIILLFVLLSELLSRAVYCSYEVS